MTTIDSRARAAIRGLTTYQPGTPIDEVKRTLKLSTSGERSRTTVIKLASNENALGPSPKAVVALRKATSNLHRYPDATCGVLREKLAKHLNVETSSLLDGNGSDELIVLALRAFVDPGDEVVVAQPTFLIYELQANACGARVRTVPLRNLRYDLSAMKAALSPKTKLVFIANPDNPTGTYVTAKELEAFLRGLPSQVLIVMDEAYYEFVEADDYPQTLRYLHNAATCPASGGVIITRSFSKAYGLAGLRVGYGVASPAVIRAMDAVREPFNVNSLAQVAASAALDDRTFLEHTRRLVREGRTFLTTELTKLGIRLIPSVTNFLLIELGPDAAEVAKQLLAHGVIVREMSAWKLDGFLRVTIGTMRENRRFIHTLKSVIKGLGD
ncbi:MAG: histidinol-phosphate transaminase [Candidatus Omnitrophica bacterium]|nr:histidinol-phosphate transaminase [Candidatus Omnitrophota bacterium]